MCSGFLSLCNTEAGRICVSPSSVQLTKQIADLEAEVDDKNARIVELEGELDNVDREIADKQVLHTQVVSALKNVRRRVTIPKAEVRPRSTSTDIVLPAFDDISARRNSAPPNRSTQSSRSSTSRSPPKSSS